LNKTFHNIITEGDFLNDEKVIISENEGNNSLLPEKEVIKEMSGAGITPEVIEPNCEQRINLGQKMPAISSESEENPDIVIKKISDHIQILQYELAESSKREEQLIQLVNEQNKMFKTRLLHDEQKEGLIDKMHDELQVLRSNLYKNLMRPILIDVLQIRDNVRRMETDLYKKYPDGLIPIKTFSDYSFELADLLEDHDVEIFDEKPGTPFIPIKQKVINRLATSDKNLSGIIVRSVSSGYMYNGQVISPQKVEVYYFNESVTQGANSDNETSQSN